MGIDIDTGRRAARCGAATLFVLGLSGGTAYAAFEAAGSSMSLDAFAIDVAPVPLPLPAALLGSAVVGLAGVGRRRSV